LVTGHFNHPHFPVGMEIIMAHIICPIMVETYPPVLLSTTVSIPSGNLLHNYGSHGPFNWMVTPE
jgi:hypothetical protein